MQRIFVLLVLLVSAASAYGGDLARMQLAFPKFRQITPAIYVGPNLMSRQGTAGLDMLVDLFGIKTNISLQGGDIDRTFIGFFAWYIQRGETINAINAEREYLQSRGVASFSMPLNSHAPKSITEDKLIRETLTLMATATPENPLYLHCEHGADRTGLLVALYRILYQNWDVPRAYAEWERWGHTKVARIVTGELDHYFFEFLKREGLVESCDASLRVGADR